MKNRRLLILFLFIPELLLPVFAAGEDTETTAGECPCCGSVGTLQIYSGGSTAYEWFDAWCTNCCYYKYYEKTNGEVTASGSRHCNWSEWEIVEEATATDSGRKIRRCQNVLSGVQCHAVQEEIIPATGASVPDPDEPHVHFAATDPAVAPSCTRTGLTEGSHCSSCGAVLTEQKEIPALSHVLATWIPNENGKHYISCLLNCGYKESRECQMMPIPVKGEGAVSICPICGYCIGADSNPVKGVEIHSGAPYRASLRVFSVETDAENKYTVIGFERGGELRQPEGKVSLTLPEELAKASYMKLDANGTVIPAEKNGRLLNLSFSPEGKEPVKIMILKEN
jgi:hypothetical protein